MVVEREDNISDDKEVIVSTKDNTSSMATLLHRQGGMKVRPKSINIIAAISTTNNNTNGIGNEGKGDG